MTSASVAVPRSATPPVTWWMLLLRGIASVLIGVFLLTDPAATIVTLMIFLGVYWLIGGVLDLVTMFIDRTNAGWKAASGILGIVAGLALVRNPLWAGILLPALLVWIMGLLGLAIGLVQLVHALRGGGWGIGILGAVSIIFGLLLLGNPIVTAIVLIPVVGVWAVIGGVVEMIYSFRLRTA
ncbi:MAG: DUF308 domain-containing protein [Chloroflexi bacterium]|nr:DUF308 domain-containing protein [Chloroflexota bacterium]